MPVRQAGLFLEARLRQNSLQKRICMQRVEIHIEGRLDPLWIDWLDGFSLAYTGKNETVLTGQVTDQAALYGLIAKLRDLGVKLLSVNYGDQITE
jgi:hypothetical protein